MKTIWKYALAVADRQVVPIPAGTGADAEILTVQTQCGEPQLWALTTDESWYENRVIRTYGTGHPIDSDLELVYIGTYQLDDGDFVGHVFEEK